MLRKKNSIVGICLSLLFFSYHEIIAQDSLQISLQEFMGIVKKYHPALKQYQIQNKIAAQNVTKAKGNFDPLLSTKLGEKKFENIPYYNQTNAEIIMPTWYGVDFNAGYNQLNGNKLNAEDTKGEVYQVGVNIPLAKNLLYDKRRAALTQAKLAENFTNAEQILNTNNFLLEAENLYWQWVQSFILFQLQKENVIKNKQRLNFTKQSFSYGERAAIDTTEVKSQIQLFLLQEKEAWIDFVTLTQELKWYMWKENETPYEITQSIFPKEIKLETSTIQYNELYQTIIPSTYRKNYQGLQLYALKQKILDNEYKLKRQEVLPKLDFSYQLYNRNFSKAEYLPLFNNNFQYGLKLELPLFLRQASADLNAIKLKRLQNQMDYQLKDKELEVKIGNLKNELDNYNEQLVIIEQNLLNYKKLLQAEETRYLNGESSVFLINSREIKVLETQIKQVSLKTKFIKTFNKLKWLSESIN